MRCLLVVVIGALSATKNDLGRITDLNPAADSRRPKGVEDTETAPSRRWRRAALTVPPLTVLACVLFGVFIPLSNGHAHHESQACRWIPLPWTIWATSYGGLLAALGAVAFGVALRWYARAHGWDPGAAWQGQLASGFAILGGFAVPLLTVTVVLTHLESAEISANLGTPMCEGLGLQ